MPNWGWLCVGGVALVVLLVAYSMYASWRERRRYQREAVPMVGWIVQANSALYRGGGMDCPAQILVAFDGQDTADEELAELAVRVAGLKGTTPDDPVEAGVAELVDDEGYRPFQRFRLPDAFTGGREVYSMHIWVERSLLPRGVLDRPFVRCLVYPDKPDTRPLMTAYQKRD